MLIAVCMLSPAYLEHVLGFTAFRLRFGGVLRGRFVPRTWFDRVPAGTVLAGTRLFRTRSDYKKLCVPRTCSRWNCTENKCERPEWGIPDDNKSCLKSGTVACLKRTCRGRVDKTTDFHTAGPRFESQPGSVALGTGTLSSLPNLYREGLKAIGPLVTCLQAACLLSGQVK